VSAARLARVRERMADTAVEVLLLSLGADLPWLSGYEAMPLERLTMLVVPREGEAVLVVPRLEAPRVEEDPDVFRLRPWSETEDPVGIVAGLIGTAGGAGKAGTAGGAGKAGAAGGARLAISDRAWATFLLQLQTRLPAAEWCPASLVTAPLRAVKDAAEIEALARASAAADRVAGQLVRGEIPLVGRTEAEVSADIGRRLRAEGHQRVNFAIVGSGPNSASPHHDAGPRIIRQGEPVVCDFGGTMDGYCSDITRTVWTGPAAPPGDFVELYGVLQEAQAAGVAAATVGTRCQDVDAVPRRIIEEGGYGPFFVHRTGHGIGREEHEDPYLVLGNRDRLRAGEAFSIEPGIYLAGRHGARIEDIVIAADGGPRPLNAVDHGLAVVDA
jgi:Xaa-Pro aminopeptidase